MEEPVFGGEDVELKLLEGTIDVISVVINCVVDVPETYSFIHSFIHLYLYIYLYSHKHDSSYSITDNKHTNNIHENINVSQSRKETMRTQKLRDSKPPIGTIKIQNQDNTKKCAKSQLSARQHANKNALALFVAYIEF